LVTAGKHVSDIRAIARQLPIATTELLVVVFSVGSTQGLYNEDPRPAGEVREFSYGILDRQEEPERGKLKNLHC
jgi:hypothetical protein